MLSEGCAQEQLVVLLGDFAFHPEVHLEAVLEVLEEALLARGVLLDEDGRLVGSALLALALELLHEF